MIALLLCIVLLLMPVTGLWFLYPSFLKGKQLPFVLKIAIGVIFFSIGLVTTYAAMLLWITVHRNGGAGALADVKMFIPVGIAINFIGIVYLLFLRKQ